MPVREAALHYLEKEIKRTNISLEHALKKPGVQIEELQNINQKLTMLEWLRECAAISTDDHDLSFSQSTSQGGEFYDALLPYDSFGHCLCRVDPA